ARQTTDRPEAGTSWRGAGDHDRDAEAAGGLAAGRDGRVVGGNDGPGDGQAKPDAVADSGPGLQPPERLEQRGHSVVRDERPAVGDLEGHGRVPDARAEPDPATGLVMPDRAGHQGPNHPLPPLPAP